jgi:hypothetical protein
MGEAEGEAGCRSEWHREEEIMMEVLTFVHEF